MFANFKKNIASLFAATVLSLGVASQAHAELTIWNQNQSAIDVYFYADGTENPSCGTNQVAFTTASTRPDTFNWGRAQLQASTLSPNTTFCIRAHSNWTGSTADEVVRITNPNTCQLIITGYYQIHVGWDLSRCQQ